MTNIEKRVYQILYTQMEIAPEELAPDLSLREQLGFDSLDAVELAIALEETFDVSITDEEVESLVTVGDIVSLLERKIRLR